MKWFAIRRIDWALIVAGCGGAAMSTFDVWWQRIICIVLFMAVADAIASGGERNIVEAARTGEDKEAGE